MPLELIELASICNGRAPSMFLRNTWYVAMWAEELQPKQLFKRTILNEDLVLFRKSDGGAAALSDRCPHRFAPLSMGRLLDNDRIQCGYHGLEIDATGACVYNPHGNHVIPPAAGTEGFPIVERHSLLWIWMGRGEPNPSTIPDFSAFDTDVPPLHIGWRDYLHIAANYRLVMDNLLDSSHVNYVHGGILGNEEMRNGTTSASQSGNAITAHRLNESVPIPGMYQPLYPRQGLCDKWVDTTWYPPSAIILRGGVCEPGAPRETGTGIFGAHLVTPETETTSHYFFSSARWNVMTQDEGENAAIRADLSRVRRAAFQDQDGPLVEAQQRIVSKLQGSGIRPALLSIDAGSARYARVLDALIAEEQAPNVGVDDLSSLRPRLRSNS